MSEELIQAVWNKAKVVDPLQAHIWRKDYAGAWICRSEYGNRNSVFGWEVDHIMPEVLNGETTLSNLSPLNWKNNSTKGDNYPNWQTGVTSFMSQNIEKVRYWRR